MATEPELHREILSATTELMNEYFFSLDARRFDTAAECFTDTVMCEYGGIELPSGRDAVIAYLRGALGTVRSTRHLATSSGVVDGPGDPRVVTHAIAYVVTGDDGDTEVQIRGLSYHDQLVRTGAGWRISSRVHTVQWVSSASAVMLVAGSDSLARAGAERAGAERE
jgi:hypothetical protein